MATFSRVGAKREKLEEWEVLQDSKKESSERLPVTILARGGMNSRTNKKIGFCSLTIFGFLVTSGQ